MNSLCEQSWPLFSIMAVGALLLLLALRLLISEFALGGDGRARIRILDVDIEAPVFLVLTLLGGVMLLAPIIAIKFCQPPAGPDVSVVENHYITEIHNQLNGTVQTPEYRIFPDPGSEVVYGDSGTFYVIDLRDRQADASIYFDPGKYNKDRLSQAYREALDSLRARLLDPLDSLALPYRLYVVGTADTLDAEDPLLGTVFGDLPERISYLKKKPGSSDQWILDVEDVPTPRDYANEDLPNLRGAYLQKLIRGMNCEATLLEGAVIQSNNPMDRRALLYLYWPADALTAGSPPPDGKPVCRR